MSEESGDDLGSVAMPGFIDILSSVLTVFMFFMLITSAIMFFMSIQMKKNVVDESRKETASKVTEEVRKYVQKVQSGELTLKELATKVEQMKNDQPVQPVDKTADKNDQPQTNPEVKAADQNQAVTLNTPMESQNPQEARATFGKSTVQKVSSDLGKKDMTVLFTDHAISVSDDTAKSIATFVANMKASAGGKPLNVEIEIPDNPQTATIEISREIGLGRMLNIRNTLLTNKLSAAGISVHTVAPQTVDNSYDWIRIHVR